MASQLGLALLLWAATSVVDAFYLPGVAPQDFKKKDVMFLKVNKISSIKNQLPYEYYSLPYCRPEKIVQSAENLGEVGEGLRSRLGSLPRQSCQTDAGAPWGPD